MNKMMTIAGALGSLHRYGNMLGRVNPGYSKAILDLRQAIADHANSGSEEPFEWPSQGQTFTPQAVYTAEQAEEALQEIERQQQEVELKEALEAIYGEGAETMDQTKTPAPKKKGK